MSDSEITDWLLPDVGEMVAGRPHLVLQTGSFILRKILFLTGCRGAVWGDQPQFRQDGVRDNSGLTDRELHRLWATPENQGYVLEHGYKAALGHCTCVINAEQDFATVQQMEADLEGLDFEVYNLVPTLYKHIDSIGWFYFPFAENWPVALVGVSDAKLSLLQYLIDICENRNMFYTHVVVEQDQAILKLSDEIKRLGGLTPGD